MKITNLSCTQFAGVRSRNITFSDGINIIFGKNESGKSTLVNLLSRTLFQSAKLDRRSDKEFFELYFPGAQKDSSITGDFADGNITFETQTGTYTLSKEWGAEPRCVLSTPNGIIRTQSKIDEILKESLLYGEGVYSDMLFSSQRNTDAALQTILDASKKTDAKQELTNIVSRAFAESDGISIAAIEQAITAKIDEIAGKHWDFERKAPVRKNTRWSNGLGEILKAYYALEDTKTLLEEISHLEADADRAVADYTNRDKAVHAAENAYNRFNAFASRLAVQNERKKSLERLERDLAKATDVLNNWPKLASDLEKAKALQDERANRELLSQYQAAQKASEEVAELQKAISSYQPSDSEIKQVKTAQRSISTLENRLCGMNLTANIRLLNENRVEIVSLLTGKTIDISAGIASITEAVKVTVPGVMEMQLSPSDVDVSDVEAQIAEQKELVAAIFSRYKVCSTEDLEALAKSISDNKAKLDAANSRLKLLLGTTSLAGLEAKKNAITSSAVRSKEEIEREIFVLCGSADIAAFITKNETLIDGHTTEYGSLNDLKAKAFDLETELKKARQSAADTEDIPAEYLAIADPEAHLEALQNDLKHKQALREAALNAKTTAASRLDVYKDSHPEAYPEAVSQAEQIFTETSSLLEHWLHIAKAFQSQKEQLHNNPMQDIAEQFSHYLGVISDGKVSSEFPEADKLSMNIYSSNHLLDYGKLSDGTKETVSLAFRLAVLDHLFPEGGGVIVFDDPFTDMDAERTAQSCQLIKACAARHQVIFLTCRKEYAEILGGNEITI